MSGIALIVSRSLRQHAVSTLITILSVALATGLVMSVFCLGQQTHDAFTGGEVGFDAVLGARGSQLQLVLNAVFHLETSPGNIPWKFYQEIKKNPRVKLAIPYAVGDNLRGFRIVGTTKELFTETVFPSGKKFVIPPPGRVFDEKKREAVIGSYVAQKLGLGLNSTFQPFHGLYFDPKNQHEEVYTIVGVLEPTNTPNDRAVWIPIEGIYRMKGHSLRFEKATADAKKDDILTPKVGETEAKAGEEIPDEYKEVSAVMLKFNNPATDGMYFKDLINNRGKDATLAWPIAAIMSDLFDKIGWIDKVLELVAYLVVLVSAGSILASIYNTMNERRREFAILRALGARRGTVFGAIVAEAGTIAFLGSLAGYFIHAAILSGAAYVIRKNTGVVLDVFQLHPVLWAAPLGMTVLGALSGIAPALKAYGTDVASNLVPAS
ncbi:MAG TPA: ABC transporter permease [Planctomycetota bacterium]|nr:ABC transporter permease [Planctomycetota bacterium]